MVEVSWCVWPCGDPTPHQTMKLTYAARPFLLKRLLCKNSAINKKQMWTWTTAVHHSTCASDSHNEGILLIWINKKVNKHTEWTLWKMIIQHLDTQMTNNHFMNSCIYIFFFLLEIQEINYFTKLKNMNTIMNSVYIFFFVILKNMYIV